MSPVSLFAGLNFVMHAMRCLKSESRGSVFHTDANYGANETLINGSGGGTFAEMMRLTVPAASVGLDEEGVFSKRGGSFFAARVDGGHDDAPPLGK